MIKVVDIFAGPGGLSEGLSSVVGDSNEKIFDVVLSIEKEEQASKTLRLRKFFHLLSPSDRQSYYDFLNGKDDASIKEDLDTLFNACPNEAAEADRRSWCATLGLPPEDENNGVSRREVNDRIEKALNGSSDFVLIGGPPCQAYSLAGRSRNAGNAKYSPTDDVRQRLYIEYLKVLADHSPSVFVMENVKGLLSATLDNERVFEMIVRDLKEPSRAVKRENRGEESLQNPQYRIFSLVQDTEFADGVLGGAVVKAEEYGVPQARHRVILLGIRSDIANKSEEQGHRPTILK